MKDIYKKRKEKLRDFFNDKKRLPTYTEMLELFSFKSRNAVAYLVNKFISDGLIEKDSKGKLIPKNIFRIKLLGEVEAGFPSPAEEELRDTITLDDYMIQKKESTYLLEVKGFSMKDAGINPRDLVLVEKGRQPAENDIVIAQVDGDWTMKRLRKKNGKAYLVAENPKYPTIHPKEELVIGGVVIGVIRKYH